MRLTTALLPLLFLPAFSLAQTVQFSVASSSIAEANAQATLHVDLSEASGSDVTVDYALSRTQARNHDWCTTKDFDLVGEQITFTAGQTSKAITLTIYDDTFQEGAEEIDVKLVNADGAHLGQRITHTLTIVDDDANMVVSVKDYGAKGDGTTEDQAAVQAAIDDVYSKGGGVINFPAGQYLIGDDVIVKANITYFGYNAKTLRLPNQGAYETTFRQAEWESGLDIRPIVFQGLHLDGNSQNQGQYQNWEKQFAHLIHVVGTNSEESTTLTNAYFEDLTLTFGTADGISVHQYVHARACHITATDVFRGGWVMTGGNSKGWVYDLVTGGEIDETGIDVEVEGEDTIEIYIDSAQLLKGDFDIAMSRAGTGAGGVVEINNLQSLGSEFFFHPKLAVSTITNSTFWVGPRNGVQNQIMQPNDVTFTNVTWVATDQNGIGVNNTLSPMGALWNVAHEPNQTEQRLTCNNCRFLVDETTVEPGDMVYAGRTDWNHIPAENNILTLNAPDIDAAYTATFHSDCISCVSNP